MINLWDQSLLGLFQKGSFAMWPLLLCSIVGIAVILERSYYFFRNRLNYSRFQFHLKELLRRGELFEAQKYCRKHANPVPRMAEVYLKNLKQDKLRDEILKREGTFALEKLESKFRVLAAITHIAPLLGLLGTVAGLVSAFHQIELLGGQVQPADLAGGIWAALVTTVFGLVIAIPCMAAYHGFESAADRIARRMKLIVVDLDEFFGKQQQTRARRVDNAQLSHEEMTTVKSV